MALRPYKPVTVRKASQGAAPLVTYPRPGQGTYVVGGNVVDVGHPALGPPLTRTPVPAPRPVVPPVGAPVPGGGIDLTDGEDPWARYTRMLDERERAAYERAAADRAARAKNLMEAMSGFGQALQGNAAEQWGNVIKAYGRAGDTATAYDQAAATSYGAGLTEANRQIAADFAAIHQGGDPTTLRDDAAALQQIATEGGARPGETMGLVGRAWGSYGETRPGSIGFMTGQNISQVARQALEADEDAQVQFLKDISDNPQQAIQMWQVMQQYKDSRTDAEAKAAQQEFENHLATTKEAREQQAWLETLAKTKTDQTGKLWVVKNGRVVPSGVNAPGSAAGRAATSAATTRRGQTLSAKSRAASLAETRAHNRISEMQADTRIGLSDREATVAERREARLQRGAKSKKNPGGYTPKQLQDWRGKARKALDSVMTTVGATRKDGLAYDASGKALGQGLPRLGVTANGEVIPRPRDVVTAAMNAGVPYTLVQQLIKSLATTRFRGSDEWQYAAANW